MPSASFYFDLGSPYAYLAAERLGEVVGDQVQWRPVSLGGLFKLNGRSSWSVGDPDRRRDGIAEVERRAGVYRLPPLRWPEPWPGNYLTAMRAATFACGLGSGREFAIGAFRLAFQEGRDLSIAGEVMRVCDAVGLDRGEVQKAVVDPQIKGALREATEEAHRRGVIGVPTVEVGGALFWGDDRLGEAAAAIRAAGGG